MAKVSKPIVILEEDRSVLMNMICSGDPELESRAKIILACESAKQNKEIAAELGIGVITVSKWKEAYRDKGLEGIRIKHSGGRHRSEKNPEDTASRISTYLNQHDNATASDIANELQIPVTTVYYELRKQGINLQRSRQWEYQSADTMSEWNPPIIGLYISNAGTMIVTATKAWCKEEGVLSGFLLTRVRKLNEELEKSVVPVSLQGLLSTAWRFTTESDSRNVTKVDECLDRAIQEWTVEDITFHVFACGLNPRYHGSRYTQCQFHNYDTEKEMTDSFHRWMGSMTMAAQLAQTEDLLQHLQEYTSHITDESEPFVWYLRRIKEGEQKQVVPSNLVLLDPATTHDCSTLEEAIASMIPERDPNGNHQPDIGAILYLRHYDGTLTLREVHSDTPFPDIDTFDFSSRDGFERDLSQLEMRSLLLAQDIADSNNEMFLDTAKKNKT